MDESHGVEGEDPRAAQSAPSRSPTADRFATLSAVADSLHESVCITTTDLEEGPTIVFVNDAFTQLTGYLPEEVIGKTPRLLQGPKTSRVELDRLRRDLAAGRSFSGTTINYRRDGSEFLMAWYVVALRDGAGRARHFLAVQRDATQERRREGMAMLFLSAFDHSSDAIILLDERGRVLHANRAGVDMIGAPLDDLIGRPARETGLGPRRLKIFRDMVAAIAEQSEWHGKLVTLMRGTVELDPAGGGETVFTVTLDATDATDSSRAPSTTRPPPRVSS